MMGGAGTAKTVQLDVQDAVDTVLPEVRRDFAGDITDEVRRDRARAWLEFECLWSGIIDQRRPGEVRFWHLTFQEFLAARRLSWLGDGEEGEDAWWPVVAAHLDDGQWHETLELLPGCLLEGGQGRADRLLERIMAQGGGDGPELLRAARVVGVIGRLLPPLEIEGYHPQPEVKAAYDEALDSVMPIFELPGATKVPWQDRVAAAEALGKSGDPRLAREDDYLLLPVTGHDVLLGRFPVTVQEYRSFVDDRGYEQQRWWTAEGWAFREQEEWQAPGEWDQQLEHPNRPVVWVSWYEADAYCRWLAEIRGREVRLPTQKEWLAACAAGSEYPWGDAEPTPEYANYSESKVESATPVGVYPLGAGPQGHLDLGGNVLEWSADEYQPTAEDLQKWNLDDKSERRWSFLRGGCWIFPALNLRAAFRLRDHASNRGSDFGFRVAVARASP
jgi:formylglycine-generating enzyme required for sulfatase activity